jgi:hypothetical protein
MTTPILRTESEGLQNLSKTTKFEQRSGHIKYRFHCLRQVVNQKYLQIQHILGKENPIDILTKILPIAVIRE